MRFRAGGFQGHRPARDPVYRALLRVARFKRTVGVGESLWLRATRHYFEERASIRRGCLVFRPRATEDISAGL
jgi:hypothetical protein